jgi:hypothetical protein
VVRLIDQNAGTGCHGNGGASYPISFLLVVYAFPSDAPGAKGEGAGNAAVVAPGDEAQA